MTHCWIHCFLLVSCFCCCPCGCVQVGITTPFSWSALQLITLYPPAAAHSLAYNISPYSPLLVRSLCEVPLVCWSWFCRRFRSCLVPVFVSLDYSRYWITSPLITLHLTTLQPDAWSSCPCFTSCVCVLTWSVLPINSVYLHPCLRVFARDRQGPTWEFTLAK